jgi:hypothetical protein
MEETTSLGGMTAIRDYCRILGLQCAESSIIALIKECGFPARKVLGQWMSDKVLIKAWHVSYISGSLPISKVEHKKEDAEKPDKTIRRRGSKSSK